MHCRIVGSVIEICSAKKSYMRKFVFVVLWILLVGGTAAVALKKYDDAIVEFLGE